AASGGVGERYATQVGALWSGLARTLAELERLAADPAGLDDEDTLGSLKQLQYRLHLASEQAYGISPPSGVEPVHAELAAALARAALQAKRRAEGFVASRTSPVRHTASGCAPGGSSSAR